MKGIDQLSGVCLDRELRRATVDLTLHPRGPASGDDPEAGPQVAPSEASA